MMIWTFVIVGVAIVALAIFVGVYNSLVRLRNEVKNSWAQIDVQLKRRTDLIPNLIETVKGYMKHEKEVLENITRARADLMKSDSVKDKAKASNQLSDTLKTLFAVSENYPELKANQNFMMLQEEVSGTENKIAYARQHYNDTVMFYNTKREVFPSNIIAGMFKFNHEDLFSTPESEKEPVKVKF